MADKLCKGKKIHLKAGAARASMRRALVEGRAEIGAKVYPCELCKGWHWGHAGGGRGAARTIGAVERAIAADKAKRERAKE
jgi:hypothetical protein